MNSPLKKVKIGIMPLEQFKERTIAIAKGQYKVQANEPKIWFHSIKSLANVLSEENQHLLQVIVEQKPQSVSELVPLTGRHANNLLRTLRTMEQYGFVELAPGKAGAKGRTPLVPKVLYDVVNIEISFYR